VLARANKTSIVVHGTPDRVSIFGVKLPMYNAQRPGTPVLQAVRVTSPQLSSAWQSAQPIALVQVTDLGVHARIGATEGVVWVTSATDGRPRANAVVTLFDGKGKRRATARSNAEGIAGLSGFAEDTAQAGYDNVEGYVIVTLGNDRALTSISQYDPDLSPWRFNVRSAWGDERLPAAGAVFTERGIYRPGEPLYAKAIVRLGNLGQLTVPSKSDSVKWTFSDREGGTLRERTVALSPFGTSDQTIALPATLPLGSYDVRVSLKRPGHYVELARASYRVAEYRPPEFLVDVATDSAARFPGDSVTARVEARYLFGAPMGRAAVSWTARQTSLDFWDLSIPGTDGYYLGENGMWWEEYQDRTPTQTIAEGSDTLDASGRTALRVALGEPPKGRPARAVIEATVTDVNRLIKQFLEMKKMMQRMSRGGMRAVRSLRLGATFRFRSRPKPPATRANR